MWRFHSAGTDLSDIFYLPSWTSSCDVCQWGFQGGPLCRPCLNPSLGISCSKHAGSLVFRPCLGTESRQSTNHAFSSSSSMNLPYPFLNPRKPLAITTFCGSEFHKIVRCLFLLPFLSLPLVGFVERRPEFDSCWQKKKKSLLLSSSAFSASLPREEVCCCS